MKEENYDRLRRALDRLPGYDVPNNLWGNIEAKLSNVPVHPTKLPQFSPPTSVWNKLSRDLDVSQQRYLRRRILLRWSARAAAALLIFSLGVWYANFDGGPKVSYTFTEETRSPAAFTNLDWNDEEASFQRIMEELADVDEPELNALRLELEELTAAKKEVEEMLRAYGNDHKMVGQLAEIESERSRVYRLAIAEL